MNDKLKELMKEANLQPYYEGQEKDIEKFSKLIVKECAAVSENYATGSMPLSISLAIKKHFGVE